MAAPLVQRVTLDSAQAQRELAQLERQLLGLNQPINVPVDIDVDGTQRAETQMGQLRREVDRTGDEFTQLERKADQSTDGILRVGTRGASAFTSLRGSILGVGAALAAIQGVRLIGAFGADAIQAASSFNESLSKTNVVFGSLSDEIEKFAAKGPEALGLSTAAALEATSTFGNLFVALGLSRAAAAEMSPDIVQLAADLASFNNIGVDEAVEKLRSGLVGEVEPLRSLGVSLNAAMVDAKAFELGFVDANGAVTEAGKVQARYALILEQTSTAQGDYARTADGVANTQRSLAAAFEDAQRKLGEALLPAYQALLELAPTLITALEDLAPVVASISQSFADAVPAVAGFADAIQTLNAVGTVIGGLKEASDVTRDFALGIGQIATGGIEQGVNQIGQGIDSIGTAIDNINVDTIRNTLVNALQAGVDPATALRDRLVELSTIGLDPTQLQAEGEALARISGVDKAGLEDVILSIRGLGDAGVLSDVDIQTLIASLRELNLIPPPPGRPGSRGGDQGDLTIDRKITQSALERASALTAAAREEAAAAKAAGVGLLEEAEAFDVLDDFATRTGQTLLSLLQDTTKLPPALQLVAANVDATSIAFLESVSRADEFADMFREIPEALATARSAFQDEAGEFETNVDDFIDNLIDSLDAEDRFQENLEKLRGVGADLLANLFDTEGIESAPLLDALLGDPGAIAAGEARLEQEAVDAATQALDAFLATIDGVDFSAIPVEPILVPLVPALDAFLATLDLVDFAALPVDAIRVPVDFVPGDTLTARAAERAAEGANVTVNQTFVTEPQPTTQTTRAGAIIGNIVNQVRGH